MSSNKWQRTLDGYTLTHEEKIEFIRRTVKIRRYYKKCVKKDCDGKVHNKKYKKYCPKHYKELLESITPFSEPLVLKILIDLNIQI